VAAIWRFLGILGVALGVAASTAMLPAGVAHAEAALGYWSCVDGSWKAIGWPNHPRPIKACGDTTVGPPTDTKERCEAQGGIWGPIGLYPEPLCVMRTIDAGRYCRDEGECASSCLADLSGPQQDLMWAGKRVVTGGYCARVAPLVGCLAMVREGVVDGILCID
jgi:hypothetical protein